MIGSYRTAFVAGLFVVFASLALAHPVRAQQSAEPAAATTAAPQASPANGATNGSATAVLNMMLGAPTPAPQSYTVFLHNAQVQRGLIDLVRKDDELFLDLGPEQFTKTYILAPSLASGLGAETFAGRLYDPILVQFKRVGRRILWVTPNTDFITNQATPSARALAVSTADSIIASTPIVAENSVTNHVAIAPALFLQDYLQIGQDLGRAAGAGGGSPGGGLVLMLGGARGGFSLDVSRSYYVSTKALPNNDEITVNLTFSGSGNLQTVPDTRGTPIKVHYSIVEEPQGPDTFVARPADDRIGYFLETQKRFGDDTLRTPFVRYIDRWDLSKGPIVFTLTNEIPQQYRAAVRRGILSWNAAFAKIGYPNAIKVEDQPNDPAFDPDDIKYNPVRWITQDRGSFVAATPHIADPVDGRILRAVITVDGESLRSLRRGYVESVAPARTPIAALSPYAQALNVKPGEQPSFDPTAMEQAVDPCLAGLCEYQEGLDTDAAFAEMAAGGGIRENSPATNRYISDYLTAVAMHETGHALGLRHNFAAESIYSLHQIHDPAFTAKHGFVGSVMGYAPVNLAPPGKPQTVYFQERLGPYDYWAIQYGYQPIPGARNPNDGLDVLRRIANRSTEHDLAFATDEDAFGSWAVDPRVVVYALSSDPLGWHRERFQIADRLFATLDKRYPRDDRTFYDERMAFATIWNEYTRSALDATRWVGGVYTSRAHRGQTGAKPPFQSIPRADQRRAFELLDRYVLSSRALRFSPRLLADLGPDRFHGWGLQGLGQRPDVPVTDIIGNLQDVVLYTIFSPTNISRINDQALMAPGKTMSLQDLFEWSRQAVYDDVPSGTDISPTHRELQRRFTDLLLQVAMLPSLYIDALGMPYESQSLARYELRRVRDEVRTGEASSRLDVATRAHLEELATRIDRGLNAGNIRGL
ncbi:MAG: zinc-dependent metalloprotease [Candidatus Eremiobacteraeota bacterium]|nr:zinc-dependent metalloprotease [Candidatus Eremiobacteraeota bacterium]